MAAARTVHVVDDDIAVRESLGFLLGVAGYSVILHGAADHFLQQRGWGRDTCVVTDMRMPGLDGLELAAKLRELGSSIPIILITGHADVPLAIQAMRLGVYEFIEKPFDDKALIVESAFAAAEDQAQENAGQLSAKERLGGLTEREFAVLDGLVAGRSNKAIAGDLDLTPRTVEACRANIMLKVKVESVSELVRIAVRAEGAPTKAL